MPGEFEPDGAQLRAFFTSTAFLRALIGPVYAGRKTCCLNDILHRATARTYARQIGWRWYVVAPARSELERYVIPVVKPWLKHGGEWTQEKGVWRYALVYALPGDRPGMRRLLEFDFLGMDDAADRKRLAAGGASGVWLTDARNLSETVLEDAIRAAGTFPSPLQGGVAWAGVICSSRMPVPGHWLITRPVEPGGLTLFRQAGGRSDEAENLRALKARGFSYEEFARERHPDWVRVNIDAELGSSASETAAAETRAAARASMTRFVEIVAPDIRPAAHHQLLIDKLEKLSRGEIKRLMFFLPPGSAKSTYGSVLFPPWYMGNNPANSIIAASHAKELAERFGRRVRNIVGSPAFNDIFGFGLSADSGAAGRWETARGGEYYAVGVDASVTGRRADLGIIDDPVKGRAEADSPTVRKHTFDWYKADFWPRLKPGAGILYIGTRWHDDDLAGRLLEEAKNGGEQWEVVSIPAIAVAGQEDPLGRVPGQRLWPEWFTDEMFEIARRDTRNWSALYQQTPMPESGDFFKSDWIRWYDRPPPREELRTLLQLPLARFRLFDEVDRAAPAGGLDPRRQLAKAAGKAEFLQQQIDLADIAQLARRHRNREAAHIVVAAEPMLDRVGDAKTFRQLDREFGRHWDSLAAATARQLALDSLGRQWRRLGFGAQRGNALPLGDADQQRVHSNSLPGRISAIRPRWASWRTTSTAMRPAIAVKSSCSMVRSGRNRHSCASAAAAIKRRASRLAGSAGSALWLGRG